MSAPLTAERLAAIRKRAKDGLAYRSYWYDSPRYTGAVFAAVSSALTVLHDDVPALLAELEQQTAELARLRTLITAPDGGGIPAPLLDELHDIAAVSGCHHRAAVAVVAETAYAVGSEHADDLKAALEHARSVALIADEERLRLFNEGNAHGRQKIEAELAEAHAEALKRGKANMLLARLNSEAHAKLDVARQQLAGVRAQAEKWQREYHPNNIMVVAAKHVLATLDTAAGVALSPTVQAEEPRECIWDGCSEPATSWGVCVEHFDTKEQHPLITARHARGVNCDLPRPCELHDATPAEMVAADNWEQQTALAMEAGQLCSDKAGWHGPHDFRPEPDAEVASCVGLPLPSGWREPAVPAAAADGPVA